MLCQNFRPARHCALHSVDGSGILLIYCSKANTPLSAFVLFLGLAALLRAQPSEGPQPVPLPPPVEAPRDLPFPGKIDLLVNLTDVERRIVNVTENIPVKAGALTLLYPQWIPGNHSPTGPISKISGLEIKTDGRVLSWTRDRVNVFAFHVQVPTGVQKIQVNFQFLVPLRSREGRISMSSNIADLAWNTVLLYPAGYFSRQITFSPSVELPSRWHFACALEKSSQDGGTVHFADTPLNTLVDSPLYAGVNFKRLDLSTDATNQVFLNVFADTPADLANTPKQLELLKEMVRQAAKLYASHHYRHYDFLFLLSDSVGGIGLEHHQSSEDGTHANYFTDWEAGISSRDLLAHEYTHSWNGKFRRPADLWTPNFNVPMQDDLLWVYEGMTQYFGYVLTARSGLRTPEQTMDLIAATAANFNISPGRDWRALVDTTNQPTISQRSAVTWVSWQRPEDYYSEGMLIWLDADTKIRELSGGKKSLDDFAKLFFGIDNGSFVTQTYTFDDLVEALNTVQAYDWKSFLHARVYAIAPHAPEDGLTRGGYHLSYSDTIPTWRKHQLRPDSAESFATSVGFALKKDGELTNVWWNSPAFHAGITPDMQLTAVNGIAYAPGKLESAIVAAEKDKAPIKLILKRGDHFETIDLDYHNGLRYPKLERVEGSPDRLSDIFAPVK